jgi:RNA polymerase sigma-70 factor (ECF subfamily)
VSPQRQREELFEKIVDENKRRILAIARSYAHGDASDLYQEILLQVWKGLDGFDHRSKPGTWVYRVALNTAITFKRKAIRRAAPGVAIAEDAAIFLLYLDDLSYEDMSDITGLQKNHIGVRINRIKKAFVERYIGS